MGLFDSFYLKIKCPYSGQEREEEFQTKQFSCCMSVWREGDEFTEMKITEGVIEEVYGGCRCEACKLWEKLMNKYNNYKCYGFGRGIEGDVLIKKGVIVGIINLKATAKDIPKAPKEELQKLKNLNQNSENHKT